MSSSFTYYLLRYVHSQVLEEVFNVGILFFFPSEKKVIFKYPKRLSQLNGVYQEFSEYLLRPYFQGFEIKANDLTSSWKGYASKKSSSLFINEELNPESFIVEDSSALQFSEPKKGVLNKDISSVVSDYFQIYFSHYQGKEFVKSKHDESYILSTFNQLLLKKEKGVFNRIRKDIVLKSDNTFLKFDLQWQNGTTNYVKSIAFDLANEENINEKSVLFYGKLNLLGDKARKDNIRYDLLVSRPTNRKLFKAYDKALRNLDNAEAPKRIITEEKYYQYADDTVKQSLSLL